MNYTNRLVRHKETNQLALVVKDKPNGILEIVRLTGSWCKWETLPKLTWSKSNVNVVNSVTHA